MASAEWEDFAEAGATEPAATRGFAFAAFPVRPYAEFTSAGNRRQAGFARLNRKTLKH